MKTSLVLAYLLLAFMLYQVSLLTRQLDSWNTWAITTTNDLNSLKTQNTFLLNLLREEAGFVRRQQDIQSQDLKDAAP